MNDSEGYYELVRTIYKLKHTNKSTSSKYVAIRNLKVFLKRPGYITKRAIETLLVEPKRLGAVLLGRKEILEYKDIKEKQVKEYNKWIRGMEEKQFNEKSAKDEIKKFTTKPLISIITPVFNPPAWALDDLIKSVLCQVYENFELLLFDFGNNEEVSKILNKYAKQDKRIVLKQNLKNKGISTNSNYCYQYANGSYVGLLDHDDLLEANTLFECVKAINATNNNADFIYTDKDKITEEGVRFDPQLKPDYSPEMLLTANYFTHFNLINRKFIDMVKGWDPQTDGAQDWDLFLKISEKTDKIVHVPKILYHWRTVKNSTANNIDIKPYVRDAQILAVSNALKRRGYSGASAYQKSDGQMYIKWRKNNQKIAVFIHGMFVSDNIESLIRNVLRQTDLHSDSPIIYMILKDDLKDSRKKHLLAKFKKLRIVEYPMGGLYKEMSKVAISLEGINTAVYMSDSILDITSFHGNWVSQLTGWLSISKVGVASGGAALNGSNIDCGSVYSKRQESFTPLFIGDSYSYDIIGYLQWTRNLLAPSKRIAAFELGLLRDPALNKEIDVRDDETTTIIGLLANISGKRVVYDPTVTAKDKANFVLIIGNSVGLTDFLKKHSPQILDVGDPYLNKGIRTKRIGIELMTKEEYIPVKGGHLALYDL